MLSSVKKGVAKLVPTESRRDKTKPVTLEHLHCLLRYLDLSNAKDAAIYAASTTAFHGVCRSSELCVPSRNLSTPLNMFPTPLGSFLIALRPVYVTPVSISHGPNLKVLKALPLFSPTSMILLLPFPLFVIIYLRIPMFHLELLFSLTKLMITTGNLSPNPIGLQGVMRFG
jgi:hypothetical protein